jgi:two-component system, sensor histidine kinase PdtaS
MRRMMTLFLGIFFCYQPLHAQLVAKPATELEALLKQDIPDAKKVPVLLQLTLYYYFEQNAAGKNLDKMFFYLQQAQQINKESFEPNFQNEIDAYYGKYFLLKDNRNKGTQYFVKIARDIENSGDMSTQIRNWGKLAGNIRALDTLGLTRIDCLSKKMGLFEKMGNKLKVIEMERAVADTHLKQGKLDIAETELLSVLEKYKSIGFTQLHYTYNLLSSVYNFQGNYNTSLNYALLTIESMKSTHDTAGIFNFYSHLANLYDELGQENESAENYSIALNRILENPIDFYSIRAAGLYTRVLIKQHKLPQALAFITGFAKKYPPVDGYGKASLACTLAWCYECSGNSLKSEKYILEMEHLESFLLKDNEISEEVEYALGRYFLNNKEFLKASFHFNRALSEASFVNAAYRKRDVYLMLFKTDSSLKNYLSAIRNLNRYRLLSDSIFTIVKNWQLQEVQVKYETEKKDQDLIFKDKNIRLLTEQSQLQLGNLRTEKNTRNMVLVCTGLLILLLGLGYNRYKLKQKNNTQLEAQQKNITDKNMRLQHLLEEKEWLVKEIHHRVKNNFHTVIGLLGTQSAYLKNEEAIGAMAESQQRIQAMSLIHQKLYQSENMSHIDMTDYIHELVDYLRDSLLTDRRIQFHFKLDRIFLGVNLAVPIGLILNEAITNAIKYAFPPNRNGNISISFTIDKTGEPCLVLVVTDDGKGLPAGFDENTSNTMGMHLMKGLVRDIDGHFTICSCSGTTIKITFSDEKKDTYS